MNDLEIETEPLSNGTEMVSVKGDLDLEGAHRIERTLLTVLEQTLSEVVVDVTRCRFVDSTALQLLFSPRLGRARGRVFPVASDRNILQLLEWQAGADRGAHG